MIQMEIVGPITPIDETHEVYVDLGIEYSVVRIV